MSDISSMQVWVVLRRRNYGANMGSFQSHAIAFDSVPILLTLLKIGWRSQISNCKATYVELIP